MPPSEMAMLNLESVRFELRVKRRELEGRYKELEQAGLRAIKKIREEIGSRKQPGESSETVTRDWTDEEAILMKDQMHRMTLLNSFEKLRFSLKRGMENKIEQVREELINIAKTLSGPEIIEQAGI